MSDVNLNPIIEGLSKRFGNVVFVQMNGKTYMRRIGKYHERNSEAQVAIRHTFTRCSEIWKSMPGILPEAWKVFSKNKGGRAGFGAFMHENFSRIRSGEPLVLCRGLGEIILETMTAETGASGEIRVSVGPAPSATQCVSVFTQKRTNGISEGVLVRHEFSAGGGTGLSVTGLESGAEYYAYAVVTEGAYIQSTEVSASRGIVCRAGS